MDITLLPFLHFIIVLLLATTNSAHDVGGVIAFSAENGLGKEPFSVEDVSTENKHVSTTDTLTPEDNQNGKIISKQRSDVDLPILLPSPEQNATSNTTTTSEIAISSSSTTEFLLTTMSTTTTNNPLQINIPMITTKKPVLAGSQHSTTKKPFKITPRPPTRKPTTISSVSNRPTRASTKKPLPNNRPKATTPKPTRKPTQSKPVGVTTLKPRPSAQATKRPTKKPGQSISGTATTKKPRPSAPANGATKRPTKKPAPDGSAKPTRRTTPRSSTKRPIQNSGSTKKPRRTTPAPASDAGASPVNRGFPRVTFYSNTDGTGRNQSFNLSKTNCGFVPSSWQGNVGSIGFNTACIQLWNTNNCEGYSWCHCDTSGFVSFDEDFLKTKKFPWKEELGAVTACYLRPAGKNDLFFWSG